MSRYKNILIKVKSPFVPNIDKTIWNDIEWLLVRMIWNDFILQCAIIYYFQ